MAISLSKTRYLLRETALGLRRGGWMNWAAVSTVAVLLFLFGISLQASWQLGGLINRFGNQLEVSVFLDTGVQATDLQPLVAKFPQVAEVTAVSKEEAWATLVQDLGLSDLQAATRQLDGNPLVDELQVKAKSPAVVEDLATQLATLTGVDEVRYVNEAVQRVAELNRGLGWVSSVIVGVLTLTAIAVITTTMRLIVLARRREIEVMQLVGATTRWIYFPFLMQGVTFGLAGAAIAWTFLFGLQQFVGQRLSQQPELVQWLSNGLQLHPLQNVLLAAILLSFGSAVGILGTLFAVRKVAVR